MYNPPLPAGRTDCVTTRPERVPEGLADLAALPPPGPRRAPPRVPRALFRVWGFGFRVLDSGFRVEGLGYRVED